MAKRIEDVNNARQGCSTLHRRRDDAADGQQQEWPRRWCRSGHRRDDRQAPDPGQRQAQAPKARRENAAGQATGLRIVDNTPCPVHPGAGHTWGECHENACNRANNNQSHAHGASGGQRRSGQKPQQRGEAQGHFVETIDSTMEQEDVSELPGGPTEISDSSPMVQDEEEQFIADEQAPRAATAESFPAFSFPASPPSLDSTGRPTPVHRTRPSQWGAASVPQSQATQLPLHAQWGHCKWPNKHTVPHKETPKPSSASVKKAPPVAAPQPSPRDETPAPPETGNGEYLLSIFHFSPFGTATAVQETHHLDLFSFNDSFLEQSLDPYGICIGSMMFPSPALPQPIDAPIPSYPTIMTRSCVSSGSVPTCASAKEELKWPEASWPALSWTGEYGKVKMSQNGSTSYTRPVGITALMSSTPPQPCKHSKSTILQLTMTKPTFGTISKRMISVTPSRTSWTLWEPEDGNTSVDCFTSTTRNIPCCQPGNATTNSIIKHGPKCARTLSRRVSFHLKTQESIRTKSTQSSITSAKKQGTRSDSDPSAKHPKKLSTSTTCSRSTFQTNCPEPRAPNQTERGPTPMTELPAEQLMARSPTMKRSLMTPKCWQLPGLAPLTESELQGLYASVLTETFPEGRTL